MTNHQLLEEIKTLKTRITSLEAGFQQHVMQRNAHEKHTESESWPMEGEKWREDERVELPTIKKSNEIPPTEDEATISRAEYFLTPEGKKYRKLVEAYVAVKDKPAQRRQMLNLILDLTNEVGPEGPTGEVAEQYDMPEKDIIDMLQLNIDIAAVAWLAAKSK
jgi:hypothetical protein